MTLPATMVMTALVRWRIATRILQWLGHTIGSLVAVTMWAQLIAGGQIAGGMSPDRATLHGS